MNIEYIINQKKTQVQKTRYRKFGLSANPFPKSGTANIYEPIDTTYSLKPIEDKTTEQIAQYVADSLYSEDCSENYRLTGIITGDHGTGKTQLLLFARALILKQEKKAYVVYISNPGTKLSELIGTIVEDIGQEQFKKYL